MKISVIMLTYNRIQFVERMINCVLNQTFKDFEFVIVNNGSTDNTCEVLEKYSLLDNRINVVTTERPLLIGEARNIGIEKSKGEYISFVDDDDSMSEDYLSFLVGLLEEYDSEITIGGTSEEYTDGSIKNQCVFSERKAITNVEAVTYLLQRKKIRAGLAAKLVKRELFVNNPFPVDAVHEDIHVTYRLMCCAKNVAIDGTPIYTFFIHGKNTSSFNNNIDCWTAEKLSEYVSAFRNRAEYISSKIPELREIAYYSLYSYEISMCRQLLEMSDGIRREVLVKMKEDLIKNKDTILEYSQLSDIERNYIWSM